MHGLRALVVGCGVTALVLSPLFREPRRDSFPLSTYPMFADHPQDPWIFTVLGVDESGAEHRLSPALITGSHEAMQAAETVRLAVSESADTQIRLCANVASRVASAGRRSLVRLVVVGLQYDPVAYFTEDGDEPRARLEYARCDVPRAPVPE